MSVPLDNVEFTTEHSIKAVCVFCGSSAGARPDYVAAAKELGTEFAKAGISLVYGGGSTGLMGAVSQAVHDNGGKVTGIIPKALAPVSGAMIGETILVDDMAERKHLMNEMSDAFVVLPGGFGTMDELLEVMTWSQLNIHSKPIVILNCRGFFQSFLDWVAFAVKEQLVPLELEKVCVPCDTPSQILGAIYAYQPPHRAYEYVWKKDEQKGLI